MLKTKTLVTIVVLLLLCSTMYLCFANSAEPPSILIIAPNAPKDLEVSIEWDKSTHKLKDFRKTDKIIETYYEIFLGNLTTYGDYILTFETESDSFDIQLNKPLHGYNNIYTLDLGSRTLTEGKLLSRSIFLISMRVSLTLIIEALVFYIIGFRNKKSWIAFLILNLLTQGALNIGINNFSPTQGYILIGLIFGEILIFIFEIAVFLIFVKEHNKLRTIIYVLTANMLSLIAGGYIITILPI